MSHVTWSEYDAVLFDLDGVVTPTAEVHMRAWAEMFNAFLQSYDGVAADRSPYTDADYFAHVDGKPRYEGVRDFLGSRGIDLPTGSPDDAPSVETVCGLGNRKNDAFNEVLARDGVAAYPGSVLLLDHLREHHALYGEHSGVRTARKHIGWYVRALPGGEAFRAGMNAIEDCEAQWQAVSDYFEDLATRMQRIPAHRDVPTDDTDDDADTHQEAATAAAR